MFNPWVRKIPWRRAGQPSPVFLPRESHGQRSPEGYSPQGHKESETMSDLAHSFTSIESLLNYYLNKVLSRQAGSKLQLNHQTLALPILPTPYNLPPSYIH